MLTALPALRNPTIAQLSDPEWVAINTIVEEKIVRQLIPKLKAAGAGRNRRISAEQGRVLMRILRLTEATQRKTLGFATRQRARGRERCRANCGRCAAPRRCGAIRVDEAAGPVGAESETAYGFRARKWRSARKAISPEFLAAVDHAARNIRAVARSQKPKEWTIEVEPRSARRPARARD